MYFYLYESLTSLRCAIHFYRDRPVHYCCYDACLDACTNRAHHRQCPPPYTEQLYRDYLKRTAPTPEGDEDFGSFLTATPPGSNGAYRPPTTPDVATPSTSTTGQNMNPYPPSNKNKG